MKKKHNKTIKSSLGFALVYVMIFATIVLMVATAIAGSAVTNFQLQRSSHGSIEAYNLARGAIDEAWRAYLDNLQTEEAKLPDGLTINPYTYDDENKIYGDTVYTTYLNYEYPAGGCSGTYHGADAQYLICYNATKHFIKSIGTYKGNKVALQANITHISPNITPAPPLPNDYYLATVNYRGTETSSVDNTNPLAPVTIYTCPPVQTVICGNAPQDADQPALPLCSDQTKFKTSCPHSEPTAVTFLTNIKFNHLFDKLEITQISL